MIGEVIDEMDLQERVIGVPPAGCAVLAYNYFDIDMGEAAHGRAAALATGLKRALPDRIVFTYQGDGDIAAIGTAETIHAAARGENFTTIFVNNGVYGMTGGQMAPTTVVGQNTTTSPGGRKEKRDGHPINLSEMLAIAKGSVYIERTAINSPANILKTKRAISKAFHVQLEGYGFSLIEVLSACPTNWKMNPVEAWKWIDEVMSLSFPLGVIKDITGDKKDAH
jgi:2-oxoglutarate ferredoxin oxidoreductase subunit beta